MTHVLDTAMFDDRNSSRWTNPVTGDVVVVSIGTIAGKPVCTLVARTASDDSSTEQCLMVGKRAWVRKCDKAGISAWVERRWLT